VIAPRFWWKKSGSSALFDLSLDKLPGPRLRVLGSLGAFVVDQPDGQEDALRAHRRPGDSGDWGAEPESRWGRLVRGEESEPVPAVNGAWPRFYDQVGLALRGRGPMPVDPRDAISVLEVLDESVET
jgi:hypothetical protein